METSDRRDQPSDTDRGVPPSEAFAELLRLLAAANPVAGASDRAGSSSPIGGVYGDAMQRAGQLMLAWAACGFRAWSRTVELWGRILPLVVEALADAGGRPIGDPADKARRVDELRAALRELAELPGRESQRLQAEIERLVFGAAGGAGSQPAPGTETHWRRWEAKP